MERLPLAIREVMTKMMTHMMIIAMKTLMKELRKRKANKRKMIRLKKNPKRSSCLLSHQRNWLSILDPKK
tara:strand:- start:62 stop:271 length:210 start_codon:yes stop_codon:yes gene_type:complete